VSALAGRRADVTAVQLDPRVRTLIERTLRQSDHQLGLVSLLAQQLEKDQRRDQASWLMPPDSEAARDGMAQKLRRSRRRSVGVPAQVSCDTGKGRSLHREQHDEV
jgi:hypothetical protein